MRKLLRVALFITIAIALVMGASYVVSPKNNNRESGMHQPTAYAFLTEKKNSVDMFVIGDSITYSSFSPMQLYEEYGFTSYICGTPAQPLYQTYDFLKMVLKNQKPKVVILEANAIHRGMKLDRYFYFQCEKAIPLLKYHDRWKNLTAEDFYKPINYTWVNDHKGYIVNRVVKPVKKTNYMKDKHEVKNIRKLNQYFMDKIRVLCEKNDIKFMIVNAPSSKNWNYAKHMGVKKYADLHNVEYLDMNLVDVGIDWNKDTRDKGDHLNHKGAVKVTHYLGEYLNKKNLLVNHKNDPQYAAWDQSLSKYNAYVAKVYKKKK